VEENDLKKFSIQTASRLSGLSTHTIRAWEKRYKALTPERFSNGRRLYSSFEIDRLIMLSELTKIGTSISQIANLPDDELKKIYQKIIHSPHLLNPIEKRPQEFDVLDLRSKLLSAVSHYHVALISQLLSDARASVSPKVFALEILTPLLHEVYERLEKNIFNTGQIQVLLAIAKFHAGNIIYSHIEISGKSGQRFILAGIEKEHHSFNLLISALLCCHHTKEFYYLNSDLPAESIVEAVKATESNILILSVPPIEATELLTYLNFIYDSLNGKIKIWIRSTSLQKWPTNQKWRNFHFVPSDTALDSLLTTS
jgi:MerR family transcriptional regulator, light-induced transcriptional regulator